MPAPTSPTDVFDFVANHNEGYLTVVKPNTLRDMRSALVQSAPFPKLMMHKNNTSPDHQGYPCIYSEPTIIRPVMTEPFPKMLIIAGPNTATQQHPEGINQGYPCTFSKTNLIRGVQLAPFPKLLLITGPDTVTPQHPEGINQGYPCTSSKINIIRGVQTYKFPKLMIVLDPIIEHVNQGYPCTFSETNVLRGVQSRPFPKLMPSFEEETDNYLCFRHNVKGFGAGSNIPTLEEIEIPHSVRYITDYAFYNTNIKKVKMHPECLYFRHSFPRGTKIAFYKDE